MQLYTRASFRAAVLANPAEAVLAAGYGAEVVTWATQLPLADIDYYARGLLHKRYAEALGFCSRLQAAMPDDRQRRRLFTDWAADTPLPHGSCPHLPALDAARWLAWLRTTRPQLHDACVLDGIEARLATGSPWLALRRLSDGRVLLCAALGPWRRVWLPGRVSR